MGHKKRWIYRNLGVRIRQKLGDIYRWWWTTYPGVPPDHLVNEDGSSMIVPRPWRLVEAYTEGVGSNNRWSCTFVQVGAIVDEPRDRVEGVYRLTPHPRAEGVIELIELKWRQGHVVETERRYFWQGPRSRRPVDHMLRSEWIASPVRMPSMTDAAAGDILVTGPGFRLDQLQTKG